MGTVELKFAFFILIPSCERILTKIVGGGGQSIYVNTIKAEDMGQTVKVESGSYVSPSTGAGAGPAAALVSVMLMACGAAGVCVWKRKK